MWLKVSKISKSPTKLAWKDVEPDDKAALSKFFYDNGMLRMDVVKVKDAVLLIGRFPTKSTLDRLEELKLSLPMWLARKKYMEENGIISTTLYEGPEEEYDQSRYF